MARRLPVRRLRRQRLRRRRGHARRRGSAAAARSWSPTPRARARARHPRSYRDVSLRPPAGHRDPPDDRRPGPRASPRNIDENLDDGRGLWLFGGSAPARRRWRCSSPRPRSTPAARRDLLAAAAAGRDPHDLRRAAATAPTPSCSTAWPRSTCCTSTTSARRRRAPGCSSSSTRSSTPATRRSARSSSRRTSRRGRARRADRRAHRLAARRRCAWPLPARRRGRGATRARPTVA